MRKNVFVFLFVVFFSFFSQASFAQGMPNLWTIEYGPELQNLGGNSLKSDEWLRKVDKVRPNASALTSKEITLPIEGISHVFVKEYSASGIAGDSVVGYVDGSPFPSVITTDKEGRVAVDAWTNQGGVAKNFKVIANTLFESDNAILAQKLVNDYRPEVGAARAGKFKIQANAKRRAVSTCGSPYWLETTAYLYDQDAVDSWLFGGDEPALRVYLQNVAHSLNTTLRNSAIDDVVVRLVKLEKVPNFPNTPTTPNLLTALVLSPYNQTKIEGGIANLALWYGGVRDQYAGLAGYNIRVNIIGGGSWVENHEFGHTKGAHHQREDPSQSMDTVYPYAYASVVPYQFSTAVAVAHLCTTGPCITIPAYSTPSVSHNGIPIGAENERDNARRIRLGIEMQGATPKCGAGVVTGSSGNSLFETKPRE